DANFAGLGVVSDDAKSVIAGDQRNQRVTRTDLRDSSTPFDLTVAVLQRIRDAVVGGDESRSDGARQEPPLGVVAIHAERTGKDVLLVEQDVEEQFAAERLEALGVARVEDTVALVEHGALSLRIVILLRRGRRLLPGLPADKRLLAWIGKSRRVLLLLC